MMSAIVSVTNAAASAPETVTASPVRMWRDS